MTTININDVKKGWKVYTRRGEVQWVEDNKKGLIRTVKAKGPFGDWDIGLTYAFRWHEAEDAVTKEYYRVTLTVAQEKKAKIIRTAGF